jgi:hypothetical protein
MKTINLDETLVDHLQCVIEEDIEHGEDHIKWLVANPGESDRELQLRDTKRSIDISKNCLRCSTTPDAT